MKVLLSFLLVLTFFIAHSQNWELFNSYDKYNYCKNYNAGTNSLTTNVLFADSFKILGSDTLYYLNRVIVPISTSCPFDSALMNMPQFLQKEIKRSAINGGYNLINPDTLVILAYAGLGDSWLYDTVHNITATIIEVDESTTFGVPDSVKIILLNTGTNDDTILLSKSFGILNFRTNSLLGIQTRGIGDSVIGFREIFDMNVGDVLMYEWRFDLLPGDRYTSYGKYAILGKQSFGDSMIYRVKEKAVGFYDNGGPVLSATDTILWVFKDSAMHVANTYPGQFYSPIYFGTSGPVNFTLAFPYAPALTYASYISHPTFSLKCKEIGSNGPCVLYDTIINGNQLIYNGTPRIDLWPQYNCTFCEGVGETNLSYGYSDGYVFDRTLIGYIKNGIQQGDVWTDSAFPTSIGAVKFDPSITVFPSLVSSNVFVNITDLSGNSEYLFALYDLTCRKILEQNILSAHSIINCTTMASSMYVWRITDSNGALKGAGKIIKQ